MVPGGSPLTQHDPVAVSAASAAWQQVWATWAGAIANAAVVVLIAWLTYGREGRRDRQRRGATIESVRYAQWLVSSTFDRLDRQKALEIDLEQLRKEYRLAEAAIANVQSGDTMDAVLAKLIQETVTYIQVLLTDLDERQELNKVTATQDYLRSVRWMAGNMKITLDLATSDFGKRFREGGTSGVP